MRESGINLPGIVHAEAIPNVLSHLLAPCINLAAEDNEILKHIPKVTITNIHGYIGVDNAIEMCECLEKILTTKEKFFGALLEDAASF